MKANEMPKRIYLLDYNDAMVTPVEGDTVYVREDAFIEKVINFLNYKLDDVVAIRVSGTIIPHHVVKQELIEDLEKYMKGE